MVHITTILYTLGMTINILNMSSAHTNVAHAIVFLMPTHFSHTWGQALSRSPNMRGFVVFQYGIGSQLQSALVVFPSNAIYMRFSEK